MNLECPHRLLSTLYHRATPLLRCWAMQSQKPMPWKILWNFSHLHPLDPSFNLFLLRLHACAEQSRGASMPPRMTLELTARLLHTGVILVQWPCVKHLEPGDNHHFWKPVQELGTAASFGGSSESGLQGWWWAERPISLWDYCNEWCGRDFEGSLFLAVACYKYEPGRVNREDWKFMEILYLVWWGELQTNMIYTELCLCIFTSNQQIVLEESEHVHVISQERI